MRPESKRIAWIDVAKGLAMIVVMADHCGIGLWPLVDYFEVPAFFVLSGLMMKRSADYCQFAWAKTKRLLVPYVVYNFFYIIMFLAAGWLAEGLEAGLRHSAWAMIVSANYPLWFLKALLWGMLVAGACISLGLLDRAKVRWVVVTMLMLAGIGTGFVAWPELAMASGMPQGLVASPLLAGAYCLKRPIIAVMAHMNKTASAILAVAALFIGWLVIDGAIGFNVARLGNPWLFYPFVALAFVGGALLSKAISPWRFSAAIEYVGRNSMRYFCLHAFAIRLAQGWGMNQPWLILSFAIVAVSVVNAAIERGKVWLRAS